MAHIESSSELSSSDDEASSDVQLQTGSKRARQVQLQKKKTADICRQLATTQCLQNVALQESW